MNSSGFSSFSKHADFVAVDLASLILAFAAAYFIKFHSFGFLDSSTWRGLLVLLLLVGLAVTLFFNPYSGIFRRRYWEEIGTQFFMASTNFIVVCVIFYLFKTGESYSREMLLITYGLYAAIALVLKYVHKRLLLARWRNHPPNSVRRLILVTRAADARRDESFVYADDLRSSIVTGFCLVDVDASGDIEGRPAEPLSRIVELCSRCNADEVLLLVDPAALDGDLTEELLENGITVRIGIAEALGATSEIQTLGRTGVIRTLDLQRYAFGTKQLLYLPVKRLFDIVIGLIGCIAMLPVILVVKLSYLATGDTHPVLYRQTRVGQRGCRFQLWKLRTMVWNADEVLAILLEDPALREEWRRNQKLADDPRITPVGHILRRTSLDELPQFFNILKGDMSVVGPRPLVPGELEEHGGRALYNKVKPGLTGWWGCNGRSDIEYYERLELEYYYVTHCSLYLDALCIFRTAVTVLKREGAR